ncbi:MAG: NADH pyrophosphatase, partial [Alteraurantiacibacter sp.]|nr:NADH pyrophosphatase [Alteraurantiacibacter sp.]
AGVRVKGVRYLASQPWPFPSQLMIGCHAIATGRDLMVDYSELADVSWFSRSQVAAALAAGDDDTEVAFLPPPATAIARMLLQHWLEGSHDRQARG